VSAHPADRPHRFYKDVTTPAGEGGFTVALDGRVARSPAGQPLSLPTLALAEAVAAEWSAQGATIDRHGMIMTRLAFTAIDRTPQAREAMAAEAAAYAAADVLCYRAEHPQALVAREAAEWDPWLDWAASELDVRLQAVHGVGHRPQPPEALAGVNALAAGLDDMALTGLLHAAGLYGSAVLAFAVQRGALGGEAAFEISRLDERFQVERWGLDADAAARVAHHAADARMLDAWFRGLAASSAPH
jgi:chaperone required for assembly of F1-ATPase